MRKGQMSDQDAADEAVRARATHYNVVLYVPQKNSRVYFTDTELTAAIEFAESVYEDPELPQARAAMVYAVDENDHFAMMGSTNRFDQKFKPVVIKVK